MESDNQRGVSSNSARATILSPYLCFQSRAVKPGSFLMTNAQNTQEALPKIVVFATGGTIVSSGDDPTQLTGYRIKGLNVESLISGVPALSAVATLEAEQIANIDSMSMTSEVWLRLARGIEAAAARDDVDGIVITHGTDTMEETAFFLNLVLKTEKPVVITGAMRPATAISADGPLNLLNAVRVAADPEARGKGVLVVLNDVIATARDATKCHPTNVATFRGPDLGMIGMIAGADILFIGESVRPHTTATEFSLADLEGLEKLPRVDIVYSHADDDGVLVDAAVAAGARAIVHAGTGNGSIHKETEKALMRAAEKGVLIIRASRTGSGAVTPGIEESQLAGFVPAGALNPQKARLLAPLIAVKYGRAGAEACRAKLEAAFRRY